jgi:hypothetical protein
MGRGVDRQTTRRGHASGVSDAIARRWRRWTEAVRHRRLSPAVALWALALAACYAAALRPGGGGSLSESLRTAAGTSPLADDHVPDGAELRLLWRGRRFFFCASPGRAGSMYMRSMLRAARGVIALHEPAPRMNDGDLRSVLLRGQREATFSARATGKVGAIHRALAGTAPDVGYAETSHMFVKTYADVVLRRIAPAAQNVTIIVLHRDVRDVAWSQLRLGWFSRGHSGRDVWYYDAEDVDPSERILPRSTRDAGDGGGEGGGEGGGDRQRLAKLASYNADVAARAKALEALVGRERAEGRLHNVDVVHYRLGGASDPVAGAAAFLESIGLTPDAGRLAVLHAQDSNGRESKKDRVAAGDLSREESDAVVARLAAQQPALRGLAR